MPSRERYAERKEAGVCVTCGVNPADTFNKRVRCVGCSTRDASLRKDLRDALISEGTCPRCRDRKIAKGRSLCKKCLALEAARYVERKPTPVVAPPVMPEPVAEPTPIAAPKPKRVRTTTPAPTEIPANKKSASKKAPVKRAAAKVAPKRAKARAAKTPTKKAPVKAGKRK